MESSKKTSAIAKHYPTIASTLALVIALTGAGAYAAKHLISGKQIKNNSIKPSKVKFPAARQVKPGAAKAGSVAHTSVGTSYQQVFVAGTYQKGTDASVLQITWTGTAGAGFSPCVFQLRVDGQPPAGGGGEVYVQNSNTVSVSNQALFSGLKTGSHEVAIFARAINGGDYPCTVGGDPGGIAQTVNAAELVQ
jgi:hypothetical protein